MSLEYEPKQHNSALAALKQRAAPPTLTEQQANVLYTMPVQTVEQLENVLQHTLALQKTIQASMATLATKESLEPLATSELLQQWLEQTQAFNQETYRSMEHILSDMKETIRQDGRQRDEFTKELSAIGSAFQKDTQEAISSLRRWIPFIIMSSAAGGGAGVYSHVANADITTEVLHLLSRLEGDPDDFVLDATIRHGHGDRKALAREQQKKIALGHKPDDHDQGQQMM